MFISVAPEPRLSSAQIRPELLSKKLGSARAIFPKARIEKNLLIRVFGGLNKKFFCKMPILMNKSDRFGC